MFDGYRDVTNVGSGGLGNVYRAVRETTGGVVAIKELRDVGSGSPMLHRARRELEALLRLKGHPYVVSVEEIIDGPRGPCLIMEFADGGSLMDRLGHGGALPCPELVLVGQHVTQALSAAHGLGIVHRDIKPHNLLVGTFGQVKVCDFGIAALTRDRSGRTQTHAMTMAYASPEELDGEHEVGPAADVYSFGATFLHLTTGRRPTFKERSDSSTLGSLADDTSNPVLATILRGLASSLAFEPHDRPTMPRLAALFDEAAFRLGTARLTHLSVPRPEPELANGEDDEAAATATVIRPRPVPNSAVPAGTHTTAAWFADPVGRYQHRYWNGEAWTEYVDVQGSWGIDPLVARTDDPSPPAMWYIDPSGRHELRYWNGSTWTEHVTTQGVAGSDPPVVGSRPMAVVSNSTHPAGWFTDPSGRNTFRYWDGSTWTDHVSTQGVVAVDPLGRRDGL